jgi:hypothetical protein
VPAATASLGTRTPRTTVSVVAGSREIDHQAHHRDRLVIEPGDADAAHFEQSGKRRRRPHQQAAVAGFEMHTIVAHQASEPQQPGFRRLEEREQEP